MLDRICEDIEMNLPGDLIDLEPVMEAFPIRRENSMNTVLIHEIMRFNRLLETILATLKDLHAAQLGEILMTE